MPVESRLAQVFSASVQIIYASFPVKSRVVPAIRAAVAINFAPCPLNSPSLRVVVHSGAAHLFVVSDSLCEMRSNPSNLTGQLGDSACEVRSSTD